jgi:CRP-like cAMP-binding protein
MKKTDPMIDVLNAVPALSILSDRALGRLVPFIDQADVTAGQVITREGVIARQAFIVVAGRATVFVDGESVATIGPGEFVGEMGMLDHQPSSATVRADTPMRLLVIGPRAFPTLIQSAQHLLSRND